MSRKDWTDDKLISRLINNKSAESYLNNINILRKRPSEELFSKCKELIKSNNPKHRIIGIEIIAQLGIPPRPFLNETLNIYIELLNIETDQDVLMSILYSIGHNNSGLNNKQIDKICSFKDNNNTIIKEGLTYALLGIDNLMAIEILIKLSTDKLNHIRNWATFGLGTQIERNNKNIREALWNRVNDKHKETKFEAIVGLVKRKDNRVNEIIKRELLNGKYGTLLFDAIIETKNKEFLPLLEHNLNNIKNEKNINPEWIKGLFKCIDELTKKDERTHNTH